MEPKSEMVTLGYCDRPWQCPSGEKVEQVRAVFMLLEMDTPAGRG